MRWIFIFLSIICTIHSRGNNPETLFNQANEAYQANDFDKAIELYKQVTALDFISAELEFNLANAYFRKDDLGRAILHYERAKLLAPNDPDINYNLAIANSGIEAIEPLPSFFLVEWWVSLRSYFSSKSWGIISIILFWCSIGGFYFWFFGKSRDQKKYGFITGLVLMLIAILPLSLAINAASIEKDSRSGVVLTPATPLKSAPDDTSTDILILQNGHKVELLDELSGWMQVQLPNGEKGWLQTERIEAI